ncbi:Lsr2 family DNA-binding protein [Nocardia vaccinii]
MCEWARTTGYTVAARGRIRSDVVEAYRKANKKQ